MGRIVFIGDELTATGLRLAGVEVTTPEPGRTAPALAEAQRSAQLVLIGSDRARDVPPAVLEEALLSLDPVVAVVPDITGTVPLPDLARRLRSILGIES